MDSESQRFVGKELPQHGRTTNPQESRCSTWITLRPFQLRMCRTQYTTRALPDTPLSFQSPSLDAVSRTSSCRKTGALIYLKRMTRIHLMHVTPISCTARQKSCNCTEPTGIHTACNVHRVLSSVCIINFHSTLVKYRNIYISLRHSKNVAEVGSEPLGSKVSSPSNTHTSF